ncbi:Plexin domain-containing protein 1, partial [Geodia barretti]
TSLSDIETTRNWKMTRVVVLLYYSTFLLHVSWTWGLDLRYRNAETEGRQQSVEATIERFTRAESNVTVSRDTHDYYRSTYYPPSHDMVGVLWQDLASMLDSGAVVDNFTTVSVLSGLRRFYEVHKLQFKFPFYGHTLESIVVTTGGFLYTGDLLHENLQHTQYIAPLQADFNPSHTDTGRILIMSTEERFTVQWDKIHNHAHLDDGPFTFQVSIFPTGVIHFVYQEDNNISYHALLYQQIPLLLDEIDNEHHPVEVGVSDAFYVIRNVSGSVTTSIFEYDRVSLDSNQNLTNSAYILSPLLNCASATSCEQCTNISSMTEFRCGWCDELQRCSDGIDRYRQDWLTAGCDDTQKSMCPTPTSTSKFSTTLPTTSPFAATTSVTPITIRLTTTSFTAAPLTTSPVTSLPLATSPVTSLRMATSINLPQTTTLVTPTTIRLNTTSFTAAPLTTSPVTSLPLATSINLPQSMIFSCTGITTM